MAAKKDDLGKDGGNDEPRGLMPPAELRAALKRAERKPASCAVALTKDRQAVILLDRLKKPRKLLADMKAQAKEGGLDLDLPSLRFGRVSAASGGPVAITLNKAVAPAVEQRLRPVMRAAGRPHFTINADPALEDEADGPDEADPDGAGGDGAGVDGVDGDAPGNEQTSDAALATPTGGAPGMAPAAPPGVTPGPAPAALPSLTPGPAAPAAAAPAPAGTNGAVRNGTAKTGTTAPRPPLAGVVPPDLARGVQAAVAVDPSRKPALARLLAGVRAGVDAGDPQATEAGIAALRQAVNSPAAPPAPPDAPDAPETTAQRRTAGPGQASPAPAAAPGAPPPLQASATLADLARAWEAEQTQAWQAKAVQPKAGPNGTARQGVPKAPTMPASKRGPAADLPLDGEGLLSGQGNGTAGLDAPELPRGDAGLVTPVFQGRGGGRVPPPGRAPPLRVPGQAPAPAPSAPPAEPAPAPPRPSPGPVVRPPGARPPGGGLPPAVRMVGEVALVVVGGAVANELNSANFDRQVVDALKRFGLDPSKPADVKAAQAYVFIRILAPARMQFWSVPSQDPGNGRVAEAVLRAVQADPDLLDRALAQEQGAMDKLEGVIQGALGAAAPAPGQAAPPGTVPGMPGGASPQPAAPGPADAAPPRPSTPGLPQQPAPGGGPQQPAWMDELNGIETRDDDERRFIEGLAMGGAKHDEIVRALDERRRSGGAAEGQGGTPAGIGGTPAIPPPTPPVPRTGRIGGVPTGTPESPEPGDDQTTIDAIEQQNLSIQRLAAVGYECELRPKPTAADGTDLRRRPDVRYGGQVGDVYTPNTSRLENIRTNMERKVLKRQAFRLIVNLSGTTATRIDLVHYLEANPIPGLLELIIDEGGAGGLYRVFPVPERLSATPPARP